MIKRFFYIFSATLFIMLSASTGVNAEVMEKKMEAIERNLNSPPGFNYQAVLRNSDGTVMASKSVTLRFTITNTVGTLWVETHSKITDAFGAVTAVIGKGTKTSGSASTFDAIDWGASDASIKVEVNTGNGFVNLGTSALNSVPYAAHAANGISQAERDMIASIPTDINELTDQDGLLNQASFDGSFNSLTDVPANLDTDATDDFSGDYNDLTNQPTIPIAIDDLADGSGNAALNGVFTANELAVAGAFNLPTADGTDGQVLTTDGAGNTSWADAAGGASYAGTGSYSFQVSGPSTYLNAAKSAYSTVGGGRGNTIEAGDGGVNYSDSYDAVIGGGNNNRINYDAQSSVIAGGDGNYIGSFAKNAAISGGNNNYISESYNGTISGGYSNQLNGAYYAAIGGGSENSVESNYGSVPGGRSNSINSGSDYSSIGGGYNNTISFTSQSSTIAGGYSNYVRSQWAFVGGGNSNSVTNNSTYGAVAGGYNNRIEDSKGGSISGGYNNGVRFTSPYGFIGGGRDNSVNGAPYGVVAGGYNNGVQTNSNNSAIVGGYSNGVTNSIGAVIGGGYTNSVKDSNYGVISGGDSNNIFGSKNSFIGGGHMNTLGSSSGGPKYATYSAIVGGSSNEIGFSGPVTHGFVGAGKDNTVSANFAATIGGIGLSTSSYATTVVGMFNATTGGNFSSAVSTDAVFVVGNGADELNKSDAMVITKDGNMQVNGNINATGTITGSSDRRLKTNIADLSNVLQTLVKLEGYKYRFNDIKTKDTESVHYGVIAQELQELYPDLVIEQKDGYLSVDYLGMIPLLLEAVKELNAQNQSLMAENDQLEQANNDLEARQSNDEARFAELESKINKLMMLVAPVDVANND